MPPLTGAVVNVTELPVHIGFADADILTDAATEGVTVIADDLAVPFPHVFEGVT